MFKSNSSFLVLYTTDINKTHYFYKQLECKIQELADDKVVVKCGDLELHFILNTSEPHHDYRYITTPENYGQGIILYLESDNILQIQERVTQAGGTIKTPVFDNHWGCKELLFEDPNGFKFAVYR